MINSEHKRRQHLSREVNSIVSAMIAISKLPDSDTIWINDKLSYFKRNMLDMSFNTFETSNPLNDISKFAYEIYNVAEKYEISKKISLPTEKFDTFLLLLKKQMEDSFKYQYLLDDMERARVSRDAFSKN